LSSVDIGLLLIMMIIMQIILFACLATAERPIKANTKKHKIV
jgi:hypothetical protein